MPAETARLAAVWRSSCGVRPGTPAAGLRWLERARMPYERRLTEVLADWLIESIGRLTALLRALPRGETPED